MTIATFYNDVRTAIGRGAANDGVFPGWAQEAISLLENGRTFQWMKQTTRIPVPVAVASNKVVLGATVKSVIWAKFGDIVNTGLSNETVTFHCELQQVEDTNITSYDNGEAVAYYWDGVDSIILDALASTPQTLFVRANVFTTWPTDTSKTPPVLARHYQAFKSIFMMVAATNLRDAALNAIWSGAGQAAIQSLIAADTDAQWAGQRHLRMGGSQANT